MTFLRNPFHRPRSVGDPQIPDGYRVYAIGDVHGRLDLLNDVLERIEADVSSFKPRNVILIFLGDLIDRGPSSAQVIERVRTYSLANARLVFLVGNHEEVLLRLLRGEGELLRDWLRFGGAECAKSYGIDPASLKRAEPGRAIGMLRKKIPEDHQSFLKSFGDTFRIGDYLFVHAGLRPGVPLTEQSQADLRWIREPFLESAEDRGFVVVHGHTICDRIDIRHNRIGIDTGAYRSGVLTAIALDGSKRWFIQSSPADRTEAASAINAVVSLSGVPSTDSSDMAASAKERCSE